MYRTEKYQKLKTEIEKQSKKLEKIKEAHGDTANLDRSKKRKIEQDEEKLKNTNRDLTMVKMKSMFAIGKKNTFVLCFNASFQGLPSPLSSQCLTPFSMVALWPSSRLPPSTGCRALATGICSVTT